MAGELYLGAGSAGAGAKLHWQAWLPAEAMRAVVVVAHGYAEHLGRYAYFAEKLNAAGIGVYALDHWGHGKSDGTYGFVPRFSAYTDGMDALLAEVATRHGDMPRFLIGHSMGGPVAVLHLLRHQAQYAGMVLSGPAMMAAQEPSRLLIWVSRFLSRFFPRAGVLPFDPTGVSRDPAVVAAYIADPLVHHGKMSARLAAELFDAMAEVRSRAGEITLPLLLLHGDQDRATAPEGSRFLNEHASSADKTLTLYPGLHHEIFNEPERDSVIADATSWIAKHLP
jgi:alpha-beta hydrolase superfamily lysophospholipase